MITLIEHLTIYDMTIEEKRRVLEEYTQFEIAGWRELLKVGSIFYNFTSKFRTGTHYLLN